MTTSPIFSGLDCALEHGAIVSISDVGGVDLIQHALYTSTKKYCNSKTNGVLHRKRDDGEAHIAYSIERREWIYEFVMSTLASHGSTHVGLEGYAYESKHGAHQIGEGGGTVRDALWASCLPFDIYDPKTVKMFATGSGNASKEEMVAACREEWIGSLRLFDCLNKTLTEDIADAYFTARLCQTEFELRTGIVVMSALPHHQIRAFNRVSDVDDQNILAREWVQKVA